jgi:uncharacterized alkaline shock family protein YloU
MPAAPQRPAAPGRSFVTRHALEDIVRAAVLGSYGVTGLAEPFLRRLRLGEQAIRVRLGPEIAVDVRLTIAAGLPVAEVARQVDSAIRYALRRALDREIGAVRIHVAGLASGPFATPGDVGDPGAADADTTAGRHRGDER